MNINLVFLMWSLLLLTPVALYGYKKYRIENKISLIEPIYLFGFIYWLSYGVNFFAVSHGIAVFESASKYLNDTLEIEVLGISLIFFYFFTIGYFLAGKIFPIPATKNSFKSDSLKIMTIATIILFSFIMFYKIYFLYKAIGQYGSIVSFRKNFIEYFTGNGVANLFISAFAEYLVVLSIVLLFTTKKRFYIVVLVFLIVANALIFYYFQTSRRVLVYCIIAAALYLYEDKKINNIQLLTTGIFAIIVVVFLLHYRSFFTPSSISSSISSQTQTSQYYSYLLELLTVSFDMFIHTVSVFWKFPLYEHWNGAFAPTSFFYDQLLSFIPRSIYADKPLVYGDFYLQNLVYPDIYAKQGINAGRFPLGIVAISYLYFGVFGMAVVGMAIGIFYNLLYELRKNSVVLSFLFLYFYMTIFNVIRSGLGNIIGQTVQICMLFFMLFLIGSVIKLVYRENS